MEFVFLDVETTGLAPDQGDRICEIALLKVHQGEEIEALDTFVNPLRPIPPEVQAITGITDGMVRSAPPFSEVAHRVARFLKEKVLVAHNISFDLGFLDAELAPFTEAPLPNPRIDTLALVRNYYSLPSYSLGSVAAALKVPTDTLHRAMADTRLTKRIFFRFLQDFELLELRTLEDLLEIQERRDAEWDRKVAAHQAEIRRSIDAGGKILWMRYLTGKGKTTEREMKPTRLEARGQYVYMRAFCYLTGEERSFRLDRIIELREKG